MLGLTWQGCRKTISALLLRFLRLPIPRFVSNQAYLGSFGTASRSLHEFERIRSKVTVNMERNVSRQYIIPVSGTVVTHTGAHVAWGLHIFKKIDAVVATAPGRRQKCYQLPGAPPRGADVDHHALTLPSVVH
ncbi:hypothetical protein TNCV_2192661 [Trichonephila clavipes]|nr:hypothetical protein TNCV_2192661 [Trichonephila clavipes]